MKGYLILENGKTFVGEHAGFEADAIGEVSFNTCMTGYQEILTDPVNAGQLIAMTYPLIGNYGVNDEDMESDGVTVSGLIVRHLCKKPSNFRATGSLNEYLIANRVAAIEGIDTRSLTREIRANGNMTAVITTNEKFDIAALKDYHIAPNLHYGQKRHIAGSGARVALVDYGAPNSFFATLQKRGYDISAFPSDVEYSALSGFDGVILSCGPADPTAYSEGIALAGKLIADGVPTLGIGLGYQLMALSAGGQITRLPHGHHGVNLPVRSEESGRTYLTHQNHAYTVKADAVGNARLTYLNLNDGSAEGLSFGKSACGVQFMPGFIENDTDTGFVFATFEQMMKGATR